MHSSFSFCCEPSEAISIHFPCLLGFLDSMTTISHCWDGGGTTLETGVFFLYSLSLPDSILVRSFSYPTIDKQNLVYHLFCKNTIRCSISDIIKTWIPRTLLYFSPEPSNAPGPGANTLFEAAIIAQRRLKGGRPTPCLLRRCEAKYLMDEDLGYYS